ncbi:hypothetical protein A2V71_04560 [Candidatus Berkelbacteria bacterium RBG_13_40_8]|uniref:Uncharacterized protein n=1 Tax=Candidatus Berkelbacteria bacterium RBG_13_40_8 TaxID=1797467 RepID=A0A1F5DMJ7_9BACT|nr:MAG: hypothetical protein A2V71_04560 [Candidatus Berkelbacteria bacterium RBG_13_40_8]
MNNSQPVLHFVLVSGLLDSFNPCAIAVLLLFIALLFTLKKSRKHILLNGSIYIIAVFLSYFAIGIGLLKVVNLFGIPHLIAIIGAWLVIAVGVWGMIESLFPGKIQLLSISLKLRQIVAHWAQQASIIGAGVAGVLLGIFEFPCSGAIYLSVISLLNDKATFFIGLLYLLLYNLMFILPLIVILLIASNRAVVEKMINFNETNSQRVRLISSLIMIGIGVVILVWFV